MRKVLTKGQVSLTNKGSGKMLRMTHGSLCDTEHHKYDINCPKTVRKYLQYLIISGDLNAIYQCLV